MPFDRLLTIKTDYPVVYPLDLVLAKVLKIGNPNHDPHTGEFTTAGGAGLSTPDIEKLKHQVQTVTQAANRFDPKKIIGPKPGELSGSAKSKLYDAFSQINEYLKDPEIGDKLWETLSSFTPQGLQMRLDAMRSGIESTVHYSSPDKALMKPKYAGNAPVRVKQALDDILKLAVIHPEVKQTLMQLLAQKKT